MKRVDPEGSDQIPLPLNLFSTKPVNVAFQNTNVVEYHPVNPYGSWPLKFSVNSGMTYLDLSQCYLQTTFKLRKKETDKAADGKTLTKMVSITNEDSVSLINGFGATFIKNLKVSFNGRQIYNSNDLYAYNAYLRRRLGIDTSRSSDELELAGYFEDDNTSQISGAGFEKRRKFIEDSKDFHTIAHLDVDFFKQHKPLLNEITMDIEITPHDAAFQLIATDKSGYWVTITDYKLYIKQHHLLPQLDESIQSALKSNTLAKYPYTRNLMNTFYISPGRYDYKATLFNDFIPKRVFVALVDAKAFNGSMAMSPFEFKSFNIQTIYLSANSKLVPTYPYDLTRKELARCFKDLINATTHTGISYEQYLSHSCIFAFDFQSHPTDKATELQHSGNTGLTIKFNTAVPLNGIQAIVFAEFDSLIAFDYARNITTALPV